MRYIMLVYEPPAHIDSRHDPAGEPYLAAWRAYHTVLVEAGVYVGGAPLKQAATATTVRLRVSTLPKFVLHLSDNSVE